ncbi:MAG: ATP-binding protein [Motiliproteus sp.]
MHIDSRNSNPPRSRQINSSQADALTEEAWVDVVHQMEEVYSDLIKYQVEIEEKNEALEEAHQFISSVLGTMTDVLIVCDPSGEIQQVNGSLEQLTGVPGASLIGRPFLELFTAESIELVNQYRSKGRNLCFQDLEVHLNSGNGDVPLSMNCAVRTDSRGRCLGMVLIGRPIGDLQKAYVQLNQSHADLKLAQQQLIDAEKMASLGRLVAGVAHELNNPISFIYGNVHSLLSYGQRLKEYVEILHSHPQQQTSAELLNSLQLKREELRIDKLLSDLPSLLDGTMEGAERVRDIVMDLRQFSSGQKEHKSRFDLVHTIQTAVHWVTREAKTKIRIGYDLPEQLMINGHPGQIQQVLINLVQNAVDAFEKVEQPRLELSVGKSEEQNQIWFQIHDNGPGIDEANLSKVFEPFYTSKPVGQGTGLGLSLSYGLVAEHGGQLKVTNHQQGGAVFTMELPLHDSAATDAEESAS